MNSLYSAIEKYAARLLSDHEMAKDITQEVFLRLEQHREEITQKRSWAYQTARNLVIDHFRKHRRYESANVELDELPASATLFDPQIILEKKENVTMIQEKINELSDRHREVLRLKFQEGLKYAEIAEILGISASNVGFILHEAITKLRQTVTQ